MGWLCLLFRSMIMNSNKIELNGAVLIQAKFTGCGGTAKISNGSIVVDGDAIDAQGFTSKNLQWFPLKKLAFKDRFNKRITRHLERIGIDTPLGTVISEEALPQTLALIEQCKTAFHIEVQSICDEYEIILDNHKFDASTKSTNCRIGTIIDALKMPKQKFKDTFKAISMPPITLSVSSTEEADEIKSMLSDNALKALVQDANHLFKKSYRSKEKVTKAATESTFALKDKFYNLSFANEGLGFVAEQFAKLLDGVAVDEQEGTTFHAMYRFVKELSEESSLIDMMVNRNELQIDDVEPEETEAEHTSSTTVDEEVDATNPAPTKATNKVLDAAKPCTKTKQQTNPTEATTVKPFKFSGFGNF